MSTDADSMVEVYSSPLAFDAAMVKSMLADEEIPSFIENVNAPFPGLNSVPCQVFVAAEHAQLARKLVEEHEARRIAHAHSDDSDTECMPDTED